MRKKKAEKKVQENTTNDIGKTEQSKDGKREEGDHLMHRVSPEESERWFRERGGASTATFVRYDPKTGKPPVLTIID